MVSRASPCYVNPHIAALCLCEQDDLVQINAKREVVLNKLRDAGQFNVESGSGHEMVDQEQGAEPAAIQTQSVLSKTDKLNAELLKLNQEIFSRQKIRRSCTGSAFITFRSTQAALIFLRNHVTNHNLAGDFKADDEEKTKNEKEYEKIALCARFSALYFLFICFCSITHFVEQGRQFCP